MDTSAKRDIFRMRRGERRQPVIDDIAVEEPLEIRVEGKSLAVVMRTPGHDRELAAGFLLTEGVVRSRGDIFDITPCGAVPDADGPASLIDVMLTHPERVDWSRFTRHVFSSSSCGICGKATIEAVQQQFPPVKAGGEMETSTLVSLPEKLRQAQETFNKTGGLHASALFNLNGDLLCLREDVGRHNALDKVIGRALLAEELPFSEHVLLVSGRVSFEIMQKALAAGIPVVAAISAPTSLAVDFAYESGQTLVGFLRGEGMNVYAHPERLT